MFIKNEGFVKAKKEKKVMVIFQNVFPPKAASRQSRIFGYPENPEFVDFESQNLKKYLLTISN